MAWEAIKMHNTWMGDGEVVDMLLFCDTILPQMEVGE